MPRPKPAPENIKVRTTVSLPKKVVLMGEAYLERHPEEDLRDFSALVSRALIDYAARKHPELLAEIVARIRAGAYGVAIKGSEISRSQSPKSAGRKHA